ncbi:histidine phosphatase family protein [Pseudodesulfovibrio piezophilus]|uniref:phosphoglycerate mutase (2,3-diphosphoglycerate-dependent) n=1 Tax=Pseudodesulfovibrio piezophilus (strain DSM 21447 / JCM 15486 / C1TLV30) TaxID=1322246 RepID=M1WKC5_PSEP2|nr:histidine phosphatase family protein [Pseudodesulfovibrio piezophilus]CCH49361.1 Phosphoglycerate mutase [Pseudodesulfovibrio piezophilus C1TLV30]
MTTFFCMRHGQTDWNQDKRIQGHTDTELNETGREMARQWGKALADNSFDCILTSPLLRASLTADLVNEALGTLPLHTDARLMEQDWGQWTGLTKAELAEIRKQVKTQEYKGFEFRPPAGESRNEVLMRVCDAFLEFADDHAGKKVLVITHNGVLKVLTYALSGLDFMPDDTPPIKPGCLHRIESFENELALGEINMEL